MQLIELANGLAEEMGYTPVKDEEEAHLVIADAAICGICFQAIPNRELEGIITLAADLGGFHELVNSALKSHDCHPEEL